MMDKGLILFLLVCFAFSIFWGKSTKIFLESRLIQGIVEYIMQYSRWHADKIRFAILWAAYLLVPILGSLLCYLVFDMPFLEFIRLKNVQESLFYTILGFVVQFQLSAFLVLLISAIKSEINWYQVIRSIGWVSVSYNLPKSIRFFYPTSSAFLEEMFFRGSVFMVLYTQFPEIPVWVSIGIVCLLFIIQQAINTQEPIQAVAISMGAISISLVGCLLILATDSILPAILCHMLYVGMYLYND